VQLWYLLGQQQWYSQNSVKTPKNGQALLGGLNGGPRICYLSFHRHMHGSHQVVSGSTLQHIEAHITDGLFRVGSHWSMQDDEQALGKARNPLSLQDGHPVASSLSFNMCRHWNAKRDESGACGLRKKHIGAARGAHNRLHDLEDDNASVQG
jgi:hypothetical protein